MKKAALYTILLIFLATLPEVFAQGLGSLAPQLTRGIDFFNTNLLAGIFLISALLLINLLLFNNAGKLGMNLYYSQVAVIINVLELAAGVAAFIFILPAIAIDFIFTFFFLTALLTFIHVVVVWHPKKAASNDLLKTIKPQITSDLGDSVSEPSKNRLAALSERPTPHHSHLENLAQPPLKMSAATEKAQMGELDEIKNLLVAARDNVGNINKLSSGAKSDINEMDGLSLAAREDMKQMDDMVEHTKKSVEELNNLLAEAKQRLENVETVSKQASSRVARISPALELEHKERMKTWRQGNLPSDRLDRVRSEMTEMRTEVSDLEKQMRSTVSKNIGRDLQPWEEIHSEKVQDEIQIKIKAREKELEPEMVDIYRLKPEHMKKKRAAKKKKAAKKKGKTVVVGPKAVKKSPKKAKKPVKKATEPKAAAKKTAVTYTIEKIPAHKVTENSERESLEKSVEGTMVSRRRIVRRTTPARGSSPKRAKKK